MPQINVKDVYALCNKRMIDFYANNRDKIRDLCNEHHLSCLQFTDFRSILMGQNGLTENIHLSLTLYNEGERKYDIAIFDRYSGIILEDYSVMSDTGFDEESLSNYSDIILAFTLELERSDINTLYILFNHQ